jgi:hypothetical protein
MRPGNGVSLRLRLISCGTFGHLANHAVRLSQTTKRSTKYMTRSKSWRSVQDWLDQLSRGGELATSFTNSIFLVILKSRCKTAKLAESTLAFVRQLS